VSLESSALQGTRGVVSSVSGDYLVRFLPPGDYRVRFSRDGFRPLEATLKVAAAQTHVLDAEMVANSVTDEIIVTSSFETISATSSGAVTTFQQSFIDELPMDRDLTATALLAPGVEGEGPRLSIAGGLSSGNVYLVNGAVAHDNLSRAPLPLYIEDAILETTTQVSGISAEYGRFTGGVVTMLTKSGGNELSGSYRLNLSNDSWNGRTPLTAEQVDKVNRVHEATLGGSLWRDRLWFFAAARSLSEESSQQLFTGEPYTSTRDERRYEGKLTFSPHPSHRVIGSYFKIDSERTNEAFSYFTPLDPSALDPERSLPEEMTALDYTGVLTESFFLEAQYSERERRFVGSGGDAEHGDRINGTPVVLPFVLAYTNTYPFCSQCGTERRSSDTTVLKASLFLSSESTGSHDLVAGLDSYNDRLFVQNFQSPSEFFIFNYSLPTYGPDGELYPVFAGYNEIDYYPILVLGQETDFTTNSAFVNDTWRLGKKLTMSLGLRWHANDGQNAIGATVADDQRLCPRFGVTYDPKGDGTWLLHASFGRYVEAISSWDANRTPNEPAGLFYLYLGPPINVDADGNFVPEYTTREALEIVFDWFDSVGGIANTDLWYSAPYLSGYNVIVEDLRSAYSDELSLGVSHRFGTSGVLRADYVHRSYGDFYATKRDLGTGQVTAEVELAESVVLSQDFDLGLVVNDDSVQRREYDALLAQLQYRLGDWLQLGANWTWSHLRENLGGSPLAYPEYQREAWSYPTASDVGHKVDLWAVWDLVSSPHHSMSLSLLHRFRTGERYGLDGPVVAGWHDHWFPNPGYHTPPATVYYWFTAPNAYRLGDVSSTNLSLNYSFSVTVGGTPVELFVQPEVLNVLNNQTPLTVNRSITTGVTDPSLELFNPYEETPVEGVHWRKGPNFGKALSEGDYQQPRTVRVSVGVRF